MTATEHGSNGASGRVQQAPGLWRTDLQWQDLSAAGREVVQDRVDIPAAARRLPGRAGRAWLASA